MSGKHFWLLLYYPQVVPYEWTPTSLSWVHYHVRPNRGSCLRNKSLLISETCLEKWICMKQLKLFQAICCMHWHERWCITTQYLLPVWPCSPGGSSAAVAIQTRNYTLDLLWRKLGVFIHPLASNVSVTSVQQGVDLCGKNAQLKNSKHSTWFHARNTNNSHVEQLCWWRQRWHKQAAASYQKRLSIE